MCMYKITSVKGTEIQEFKGDIINLLEKIKHELSELKKKVEIVLDYRNIQFITKI